MELNKKGLYDYLLSELPKIQEKIALVDKNTKITYKKMIELIDKCSYYLSKNNINKKMHIALYGEASIDWTILFLSIIRIGAVVVPLNNKLPYQSLSKMISFSDSNYFFTTDDIDETFKEGLQNDCKLKKENIFKFNISDIENIEIKENISYDRDYMDDSIMLFTSGTEGMPKGVLVSENAIMNKMLSQYDISKKSVDIAGEKAMIAIPLFHNYAIICLHQTLYNHASIYLIEKLDPVYLANLINKEKIGFLFSVYPIYYAFISNDYLKGQVINELKICYISGSSISKEQFEKFESTLTNAIFVNMYGLSETVGSVAMASPIDTKENRYTKIGKVVSGVEARTYDKEKGILPIGEVGEIVVKSMALKNSYYKLSVSEQNIDKDGWFHTGDLGIVDKDGYLIYIDRMKNLIIKGGENISPIELENELKTINGINEVAILSCKDEKYGENIIACVTMKESSVFDEDETRKILKERLGSYKVPKSFYVFDKFEKVTLGKIDKSKIKEVLKEKGVELC